VLKGRNSPCTRSLGYFCVRDCLISSRFCRLASVMPCAESQLHCGHCELLEAGGVRTPVPDDDGRALSVVDEEMMETSADVDGRRWRATRLLLAAAVDAVDAVDADVLWRDSIFGVLDSVRVDGGRSFSLFLELRLDDRAADALLFRRELGRDAAISCRSRTSSHVSILINGFDSFLSLFSVDSSDSSGSLETLATALHHVEFETQETLLSVLALL